MIKTYQRPLWESEQLHDCATCGRKAGNICRTNKGLATKEPHSARCKAWYEAGVSSGFIKVFGVVPSVSTSFQEHVQDHGAKEL